MMEEINLFFLTKISHIIGLYSDYMIMGFARKTNISISSRCGEPHVSFYAAKLWKQIIP